MRVLIVDDDALVAQSLSTILSVEDDVEVVGLGCSGPEATERYRELTPDILLMDIQMPGGDGLSAAERILAEDAGARIVEVDGDPAVLTWPVGAAARHRKVLTSEE